LLLLLVLLLLFLLLLSLYLEDIRHFFEPEAKEENGIPVVNWDLSSPDRIWMNSPLAGYDKNLLR
jgi:hypothetical protein